MRTVVIGERPAELESWLHRRRALGLDGFDEVWEGVVHVVPAPHGRHSALDQQLAELLGPAARAVGLQSLGPINLGRLGDYRVPDRCVVSESAELATFFPTAIVVVEILSPDDETFDKFSFYLDHGVVELLIVDPLERTTRWFARGDSGFVETSSSAVLPGLGGLGARLRWSP